MKRFTLRRTKGNGPDEIELRFERKPMDMEDPVLIAGSTHTANATFTVTPSGTAFTAELYLTTTNNGTVKAVTSNPQPFTSIGVAQTTPLTITMPSPAVGTSYYVELNIVTAGALLAAYQATDNVIIPVVSTPVVTWS